MARTEAFSALLVELAAMPAGSRRAILRMLSPDERAALAELPTVGPNLVGVSPWLAARIEAVRTSGLDSPATRMTSAARHALLASAGLASSGSPPPPAIKRASGASLLETVGNALSARIARA